MAVWLVRTGAHGEYEQKYIQENRVYVTWQQLNVDLSKMTDRHELVEAMEDRYMDSKPKTILNWVSQVWPFAHEMQKGDMVVVPLKTQPAIQFGEITSDYEYNSAGPDPFFHWRSVKWIGEPVPRSNFAQDLLYSFGAFMTICRIRRNNAEERLAAMRANNWKPESISAPFIRPDVADEELTGNANLEELARDQISLLINAHFKGHDLTRLVDAILRAQGYSTFISPEGPDGGVDILAGTGALGFGEPRLCVEVKSGDAPADRETVDKLIGAVTKFSAHEGLFVSWSGYRSSVHKELSRSFFKVRLWSQKELLEALFSVYDKIDDDLKAELPLKRIWTVAAQED